MPDDSVERAEVEAVGHRNANVDGLPGPEQVGGRIIGKTGLHVEPIGTVVSSRINDEDDRIGLVEP